MPRGARSYPPEFRTEAVRLARERGNMTATAKDLGVSLESLRKWMHQQDVDAGAAEGLSTEEKEELRRLRREVRVLREEREILKKAAAFFAKEETTR